MTSPVFSALDPARSGTVSAVSLDIIQKRRDFLWVNGGRRAATPAFVLLGRDRGDQGAPRVGFTCSKKVGNAVARNRAKRRLRALAREFLGGAAQPGWDYVMIGRRDVTAVRAYTALADDLLRALSKIHTSQT